MQKVTRRSFVTSVGAASEVFMTGDHGCDDWLLT
jgi:hypothetical protein